jgi:hypothetical protein
MEALDPVGKEDGDIDNDGDKDKSDKYLAKRRKEIGKAVKKEEFSDWRTEMGLEEAKCNNSKEGSKCAVHGTADCNSEETVDEGCGCSGSKKIKKY